MARILAKALNCEPGPTATPDKVCHACVSIAAGTSLDVVEMDAASQRGIDDIREIRDRVILQPAEGRYKVYILDEAHQLTDAAWNALLKLIEEPPPHLVFVFCTTDLAKVLPTVRSRCQTFVFARPRLPRARPRAAADRRRREDRGARRSARADRPRRRAARSATPSPHSTSSPPRPGTQIDVQSVLQLLGAVEEDALFRLCDAIVDRDTAGALVFLEELAEQGQDLGRLVTDLLEHLRAPPARPAHGPRARLAARHRRDARAAAGAGEPAAGADGAAALRPARRRRRGLAPGRRPAAATRARARQGDESRLRPLTRVARVPGRAARAAADGGLQPAPAAPRRRVGHSRAGAPDAERRSPRPSRRRPRPRRRRSGSSSSRTPGSAPSSRRSVALDPRRSHSSPRPARRRSRTSADARVPAPAPTSTARPRSEERHA